MDAPVTTSSSKNGTSINRTIKAPVEAVAQIVGQNITAATKTALAEEVQVVLAEQERLVMSERDFARFIEILEDSAPSTSSLVKAMRDYQVTKAAHPDRGL
ncbi:hypothetical protein IAD21_02682 [Abditibacteriota bacterium]|nr:hypothetical protein IAD21_02682 [Abditibacteriota bacterium]